MAVTTDVLERLPPQNLEAERGVLGSLMLDPDLCDEIALELRAEDFYAHAHQVLYGHMLAMHNDGLRIDSTLLVDRLDAHKDLDTIGGMAYLADVVHGVPTAANAAYYAQIVRDKSTLRSLIHASTEILANAYDQSNDSRELLGLAEEKLFRILEDQGAAELAPMRDVLHEALVRIDARLNGKGIGGTPTGFTDLDHLTGGLHESELVILAARPSMGKTALATNMAEHVAIESGEPVLFVSLEMSRLELAERMLCAHGRINGHKLRNGYISPADRKKLIESSSAMSQAPLFIDDSPSRTMTEIGATARRLKRREGRLALVVIDYLQLIEPDNSKDPRQEQVAKIARRLKCLARELKTPILCLAQLNRQAEVSKDNRPRLSHLRESGAIEQDADVVMFVHRDEYYMANDEDRQRVAGEADIIIAKQRNGPIGDVKLAWLSDYTRFENLAKAGYDFDQF
jgi:replicative DNA helicase